MSILVPVHVLLNSRSSRVYCKETPVSRDGPHPSAGPELSSFLLYFLRRGLGPSLRIRSVIWIAALAKACAWLPDM